MKLRTTGRSIRLRLNQDDVRRFVETGIVEETITFGHSAGSAFGYRLVRSDQPTLTSNFDNGVITVAVPIDEALEWAETDRVGIEAVCDNDTSAGLAILIEKDFACLTPRAGDDDKGTFPNPLADAAH
jgi:hypothetical protein